MLWIARFRPACGVLGMAVFGLFLVTAFTPFEAYVRLGLTVPAEIVPSDAIVVLAGGGAYGGVLSHDSASRAVRGIALFQQGLARWLLFSGGVAKGEQVSEAALRAELARGRGVPPGAILLETEARTTHEEATREKPILQAKGVRTVLLVSTSLHLMRARRLFEQAGFEVHPVPSDIVLEAANPESRLQDARELVIDLVGLLYYRAGLQ